MSLLLARSSPPEIIKLRAAVAPMNATRLRALLHPPAPVVVNLQPRTDGYRNDAVLANKERKLQSREGEPEELPDVAGENDKGKPRSGDRDSKNEEREAVHAFKLWSAPEQTGDVATVLRRSSSIREFLDCGC